MHTDLALFVIGTLLTIAGALALFILNKINSSIEKAIESINNLNIEVAEVIKEVKYHDSRISKLEELTND